ncbi:MAG: DUF1176 domain-containing protein [Caulobacter sp.]|nr:DUF1176 domain-containing protein [Caulobacter sp.]
MRALAAVVAGLLLLAATPAAAAGQKSFGDWMAVCDNLNTCVAFAFPEAYGDGAWLRLERTGEPGAQVTLVIAIQAEEAPGAGGGPWTITVDGQQVIGRVTLTPVEDDTGYWRAEISLSSAHEVAAAIREGASLTVTRKGREPVVLPLKGAAATMIWIDEQQGRIGSPTALSRAPGAPSAIMVPATPVIRAGPAVSQASLPTVVPASVMAVIGACEEPETAAGEALIARLAPGVVLYAPVCSQGAYNRIHYLAIADEAGRGARPLRLPQAPGSTEATTTEAWNLHYDPASHTLLAFAKGRGLGDCGSEDQWVWDGAAFQLLVTRVMGDCRGVPFDDWPTLYRAVVKP